MHRRITLVDWARLSRQDERAVTKVYMKCRMGEHERAQGMKRVDSLLGRMKMLGLVRSGMEDGWEVVRMILADQYCGRGWTFALS
jgi:hypothetical protein